METPVYNKLISYKNKNRIPFAMPGHKNMRSLPTDLISCDFTELNATSDLHYGDESTNRANDLLSRLYNTKQSFILVSGSTTCIQVMLSSVLSPGDTLLTFSDCHMSVINTCALCGFKLKIAPISYNEEFMIPLAEKDFNLTPDIKAVLLTSPNYYGITKNIELISRKCKKANIPLLVDEAHGAHFIASKQLPDSAVAKGADMVCHSAHKTLNALTGAAYLHICTDTINADRVKKAIMAFETSSPSYPVAASADIARATLKKSNYESILKECNDFKSAILSITKIKVLTGNDPLRIVLSFSRYKVTGFDILEKLSSYYGIDVEMADMTNIVLIVTPANTHSDFISLFHSLCEITGTLEEETKQKQFIPPPPSPLTLSPSEGWFANTEKVALTKAVGRISSSVVTAYPPGCAIIVTGEKITKEKTDYIDLLKKQNAKITGIEEDKIEVVI
jgi:arginine/lysine/ornithine decarboxylase